MHNTTKHTTPLGNYDVPTGWPMKPYKRPYGGTPGPPVMYEKPSDPEDEGAGYGYSNAEGLEENDIYFYHSDHLGSTSYITDKDGNATQFVSYKPYGEALVDEHNTTYEQPWKFNGKELDAETGLYYYGARYYEPVLAMWYGEDALAEKYPSMGGYVYCAGNPVKLVDVDGNEPFDYLLGVVGAFTDNALCGLVDFRSYCAGFATDAKDFNGGLIAGDMLSVAIGVYEMNSGAGMMTAGTATVTVGVAAEVPTAGTSTIVVGVGGVGILGGAALEAHGVSMMAQGAYNIENKKGHLPENAPSEANISSSSKGPTIPSKTLWQNGKYRIAVENPKNRQGQIHIQDNKHNKYLYRDGSFYSKNAQTGKYDNPAPREVNKLLEKQDV